MRNRLGPVQRWRRGPKEPRLYDWTAVDIRPLREPGKGHWLLIRRSIANPGVLAYFVCFGPDVTALEELVRVAGTGWTIEECYEEATGQVGLDQYEVRRWEGQYRQHHPGDAGPCLSCDGPESGVGKGEKGAVTAPVRI